MRGKVVVYIGSGMCIYAANEDSGVVLEPLSNTPWTEWFYISGIQYNN